MQRSQKPKKTAKPVEAPKVGSGDAAKHPDSLEQAPRVSPRQGYLGGYE